MMEIFKSAPQIDLPGPPWLAKVTAPAGPAIPADTTCGNARVITLPGRYSVMHVVVGKEELIVADTGSSSDIPMLESVAEWLGKPYRHFIPTHLHFDHIMGIETACNRFGASVALGEKAFDLIIKGARPRQPIKSTLINFFIPYVWQGLPGAAREDLPGGFSYGFPWSTNRFSSIGPRLIDGAEIPGFNGWKAIQTPGHTDECTSLFHEESGFFICGDTVRNFQGGEWNSIITDRKLYKATIEKLKKLRVRAIFPGHGPVIIGDNLINEIRSR